MRTLLALLLSLGSIQAADFIDVETLPERIYWLESGGQIVSNEFQSLGDAPSMIRISHDSLNGVEVKSKLSGFGLVDLENGWDRVSLYPQTTSHGHKHADLFLAAHKSADGEFGGFNADDIIRIDDGATARITSPVRCRALAIKGTLTIASDVECETILVYSSGHLSVTEGTISFTGSVAHDPSQSAVGLFSAGQVTIHGGDVENFALLQQDSETSLAGTTTWQVGDNLAFPDMQRVRYTIYQLRNYRPLKSQAETAQIVRIDGQQITIHPPLKYDHRDTQTGLVPVGNLSNRITFETKPGSIVRAHAFFSCHHVPVRVQGATFRAMGRTSSSLITPAGGLNQIGRYPLHAHHCTDFLFEDCVVIGSPRHGIVHHNSAGRVRDCFVVDAMASGIFAEEGGETGAWESNTVFSACYDSTLLNDDQLFGSNSGKELGAGGFCYWLRTHNVNLVDNAAYGFAMAAYGSFTHTLFTKQTEALPFVFRGNSFHGSAESTLRFAYDAKPLLVEDINAWNRMTNCEGLAAIHCLDFTFKGGTMGADQGRVSFLNLNGLATSKLQLDGLTRKGSWQSLLYRFTQ